MRLQIYRRLSSCSNGSNSNTSSLLFPPVALQAFVCEVFSKLGMSTADSRLVSSLLVEADLRGQEGHGVSRIPIYSKRISLGLVNPRPRVSITFPTKSTALVDGDWGMGFVVATRAMGEAMEIAKTEGVGLVGVKNSTHFGASAAYVMQAAEADLISLLLTNSSPAQPPWGGRIPLLGASPLAAAVPAGRYAPFVLDMATTVTARGKLRLAAARNEPIQPGIALNKDGQPTTDGMEAFHGVVLPFGGVKGSGIVMLIEILAGVLTGSDFAGKVTNLYTDFANKQNVGHFIITLRPDLFMPLDVFKARMDTLIDTIKSQPMATGFSEILYAGEPEARMKKSRVQADQVPVQRSTVDMLVQVAKELNASFPEPL